MEDGAVINQPVCNTVPQRTNYKKSCWEGKTPHTRGAGGSEARLCACGKKISVQDTHPVCSACLGLEHAQKALDAPGSCHHCTAFTLKSLRRRLARQVIILSEQGPFLPPFGTKAVAVERMETCAKPMKKQPQYSGDIVFLKGNSIQTLPCLSEQVKGIPESIIGLHYVWEYRSPSKSAPPHYQCKLCSVSCLQNEIIDHVKGWKHSLKYMEKRHPDKVSWEKDEATRDTEVRRAIKEAAAEVEQMEGKGQIKVVLKEPSEVPAFKGRGSTKPKQPPGMKRMGPPFNPEFPGPFPRRGDPFSDRQEEYSQPGFGNFPSRSDFPESGNNQRPFLGGMEGHSAMGGRDGYLSGQYEENHGILYPDKYMGGQMDGPMNRPTDRPELGESPQNLSSTLLSYLDSFRIGNEDDAQLVLKVTQKLTDVLMEYRLRSINKGSSLNNMSMSNSNFSQSPSRFPGGSNQYSGPSRFSDGPSRFYR